MKNANVPQPDSISSEVLEITVRQTCISYHGRCFFIWTELDGCGSARKSSMRLPVVIGVTFSQYIGIAEKLFRATRQTNPGDRKSTARTV